MKVANALLEESRAEGGLGEGRHAEGLAPCEAAPKEDNRTLDVWLNPDKPRQEARVRFDAPNISGIGIFGG